MADETGYKRMRELISALSDKLGALEESVLACCGVTLAQCNTLVEIGRAGSVSLGELAGRLGLDNSTLSRTVNNLVTKGLCERVENPQDRRYVAIRLAGKGLSLYETVECGTTGWYEAVYEALPEGKRAQVLESMELMLKAVETARNASGCGC